MFIDMWYGNRIEEVDMIDYGYYDHDCEYRGYMFIKGRPVGDFKTDRFSEIWQKFKHIKN